MLNTSLTLVFCPEKVKQFSHSHDYALQVVTGSHDCTIRLWDLAAGKSKVTLTNHKKSVRSVVLHPTQ